MFAFVVFVSVFQY